ncbi:MAG: RNA polymerase sigma factor [Endomicrobia bacterium]|nr:RNA polymerase sigma factor [Endomicrobiia bacterium]MCX7715866.1 RNA polymerase sigma factor [Endomicrobiia bacterium]
MNFSDSDDFHIVSLLKDDTISLQQKEKLFEQIVEKYKEKVFNMVYNYAKSSLVVEDVEDIVVETFIRFYKNVKGFKFKCSVETYLRRIAMNLTINFIKSKNKSVTIDLEELSLLMDEKEALSDVIYKEQLKKIFSEILNRLPERQKIAFHLAYYENMSYKEIAELLNTTVSSVESLLFRAKKNIKKYVLKNKDIFKKIGLEIE